MHSMQANQCRHSVQAIHCRYRRRIDFVARTQGGPEGNPIYGIALLPLIKRFHDLVKQFWYADDSAGGRKLELKS